MIEQVILVDEHDREIGIDEKLAAHEAGKLHRAVSVFVFDGRGNMLIQQRAVTKYHSGGLWSNTCCSHPRPGEANEQAVHRRLREEMGFDCLLEPAFNFVYKSRLTNDLWEHEYDHVFVGRFDGTPVPDSDEVHDWRWVDIDHLVGDAGAHPEEYTVWFKLALEKFRERGSFYPDDDITDISPDAVRGPH
jgi:isopentenyl-diphosphate delta-isomerase